MRLFVGVDLPSSLADALADVQAAFADCAGCRLPDPTQAHITLFFLGETDPQRVSEIEGALETAVETAAVEPVDCTVGGLGVFPSPSRSRVVWTGVRDGAGDAELRRLNEAIESELTALGFAPPAHEFTPHVTLARLSDARSRPTVQRIVSGADPTVGTFQMDSIQLIERTQTADRAVYETVAEISL